MGNQLGNEYHYEYLEADQLYEEYWIGMKTDEPIGSDGLWGSSDMHGIPYDDIFILSSS